MMPTWLSSKSTTIRNKKRPRQAAPSGEKKGEHENGKMSLNADLHPVDGMPKSSGIAVLTVISIRVYLP